MIQRIQTVYLALVIILATLLLTTLTIGYFTAQNSGVSETYMYKAYAVQGASTGEKVPLSSSIFLTVELLIVLIITAITIGMYRKRILQLKLGKFNLFVHFILIAIMFFYTESEFKKVLPDHIITVSYSIGAFVPLLNIVFILLANRAVKKDEMLVRSADRLR